MDPLEVVLAKIEQELRQLNDQKDALVGREAREATWRSTQQWPHSSGSRFAGPGAAADVLDQLAAGGSIQQPHAKGLARGRTHDERGAGLAGVINKALAEATPSAGGYLVAPQVAAGVLRSLRTKSAVMRMGVTVTPVEKELAITSLSSGATAYYVAENAQIPVSEQTFAQDVLLQPKELAALVPASNRLLRDAASNPDIEDVIREDMAEVLALRADLAFLRGDGSAASPVGIRNKAGLTPAPSLGANGRTPTFDDLMDVVAALRAVNAPFNRPGWIFNGRLLSTLEKVKDNDGRYLADAGLLTFDPTGGGGTLLGFRFVTTAQIPVVLTTGTSNDTTDVYFSSDWNEAWIGENENLSIDASGDASYWDGTQWVNAFQNRQTLFRAVMAHDIGLRRPQLFTVMTGVRP